MAVAWVGSIHWTPAELWTAVHPSSDRDNYLTSILASDGTGTATLTASPQATAALAGDGTSAATLLAVPPLTATLLINN